MADLIVPTRKELLVRKKIHSDKKTMSFSGKIESFDEKDLDAFYQTCSLSNEKEYCYRLVFCDGCMDYVSETEWKYDRSIQGYWWNAIVRYDLRHVGYGNETLRLMKSEAVKYDIHAFHTIISKDNSAARSFLQNARFSFVKEDGDQEIYRLVF